VNKSDKQTTNKKIATTNFISCLQFSVCEYLLGTYLRSIGKSTKVVNRNRIIYSAIYNQITPHSFKTLSNGPIIFCFRRALVDNSPW